jgi:hypothetical protein
MVIVIVIAITIAIIAGTVVTTDIDRLLDVRWNNSLRSTVGKSVMIDGIW